MNSIRTFVFLELETTGLPEEEGNQTKITELCLVAVQSEHIRLGVEPRVQFKLNLPFNPQRHIGEMAKYVSGLSNDLLESVPEFQYGMCLINNFFSLLQEPICLVAHYGLFFDFPIIKSEISRAGSELPASFLYIDSLHAFQQLHGVSATHSDSIPKRFKRYYSFKLVDVYKRLVTKKKPVDDHNADAKVNLLIKCVTTYGELFVMWANQHAKPFSEIPAMETEEKKYMIHN